MERRQFIKNSTLSGTGFITGSKLLKGAPGWMPNPVAPFAIKGNRFVTLCIMIRTTPWEVSRDVKLHTRDEAKWHQLQQSLSTQAQKSPKKTGV